MTDDNMDGSESIRTQESSANTPVEVRTLKIWLATNRQDLTVAGIVSIEGRYSGSGDDGNFDEIVCLGPEGLYIDSYEVPKEIADLIESLADKLAAPGYENNDGGGGTVELKIGDGTITHQSFWYVTECSYEDRETF